MPQILIDTTPKAVPQHQLVAAGGYPRPGGHVPEDGKLQRGVVYGGEYGAKLDNGMAVDGRPQVIASNLGGMLLGDSIELCRLATSRKGKPRDIAAYITHELHEAWGGFWQCIVGESFGLDFTHDGPFLHSRIRHNDIIFWRSLPQPDNLFEQVQTRHTEAFVSSREGSTRDSYGSRYTYTYPSDYSSQEYTGRRSRPWTAYTDESRRHRYALETFTEPSYRGYRGSPRHRSNRDRGYTASQADTYGPRSFDSRRRR